MNKFPKKLLAVMAAASLSLAASADNPADKPADSSLGVDIDALLFFQNNEYEAFAKGYSLPGFRLRPTLVYNHGKYIKLEAGVEVLKYWGANSYPNVNYLGIPDYDGANKTKGLHWIPYLRATMSTKFGLTFVMGNLYTRRSTSLSISESNAHGLIEPMYAHEYAYSADPEAGVQILYNSRIVDADIWLDWRDFIFKQQEGQEHFIGGLSMKLKYNSPMSEVHFYTPVQTVIQHYGGEINKKPSNGVVTQINVAAGAGMKYHTDRKALRSVSAEADFLASQQTAGALWMNNRGTAIYARAGVDLWGINAQVGYYRADRFMSILGLPIWSTQGTTHEQVIYNKPQTLFLCLDYAYEFYPGFSIGADLQLYNLLNCDIYNMLQGSHTRIDTKTSVLFGITMRMQPSFLLKKFSKKQSKNKQKN